MSREFKFRAWSRQYKKMYAIKRLYFDPDGMLRVIYPASPDNEWIADSNDLILMQYTGLKDNNGRDIYEGDILSVAGSKVEVKFGLFRASELSIVDGYEWEDAGRAMAWIINEDDASRGEVIGDIYKNPELLKKDDNT